MAKRAFGVGKRNVDPSTIEEVSVQLGQTKHSYLASKEKTSGRVDPRAINKIINPRKTYCTLEEVATTPWPDLDVPSEDTPQLVSEVVSNAPWAASFSPVELDECVDFFVGIHLLAVAILDQSQLQPVILERDGETSLEYDLIAGERRLLAALYSRGAISSLNAEIHNKKLDPLARAKAIDGENLKSDLSGGEQLASKMAICDALGDAAKDLSIRELARHLSYSSTTIPRLVKTLLSMPDKERDCFISEARDKRLGWREIRKLLTPEQSNPPGGSKSSPATSLKKYGLNLGNPKAHGVITLLLDVATGKAPIDVLPQGLADIDTHDIDQLAKLLLQAAEQDRK